jgi:hypothetical protein
MQNSNPTKQNMKELREQFDTERHDMKKVGFFWRPLALGVGATLVFSAITGGLIALPILLAFPPLAFAFCIIGAIISAVCALMAVIGTCGHIHDHIKAKQKYNQAFQNFVQQKVKDSSQNQINLHNYEGEENEKDSKSSRIYDGKNNEIQESSYNAEGGSENLNEEGVDTVKKSERGVRLQTNNILDDNDVLGNVQLDGTKQNQSNSKKSVSRASSAKQGNKTSQMRV